MFVIVHSNLDVISYIIIIKSYSITIVFKIEKKISETDATNMIY